MTKKLSNQKPKGFLGKHIHIIFVMRTFQAILQQTGFSQGDTRGLTRWIK